MKAYSTTSKKNREVPEQLDGIDYFIAYTKSLIEYLELKFKVRGGIR